MGSPDPATGGPPPLRSEGAPCAAPWGAAGEPVNQVPFLSEDERLRARAAVHELKDAWTSRSPYVPFFTLGAAAYLDAMPRRYEKYVAAVQRQNPLMRERFGWLYDRLAAALADTLKAPVAYPEAVGLPGFHIYLSCPIFREPVASLHKDRQQHHVPWSESLRQQLDFGQVLSFTVPVALPTGGAGLKVWDIPEEELRGTRWAELVPRLPRYEVRYHPYEPGALVLHDGEHVHQAVLMPVAAPQDERITLQGHLIRGGGTWQIYW